MYDVKLLVSSKLGSDSLLKTNHIKVETPTAIISGNAKIYQGGYSFIKFSLTGIPDFNVKFTDGKDTFGFTTKQDVYYYPVRLDSAKKYRIIEFSDSLCFGTFSGSAKIEIIRGNCDVKSFQIAFGGAQDDIATSIIELANGEFIVGGTTSSAGYGSEDILIIKVNVDGAIVWQKTIGNSAKNELRTLIIDKDSIIIGAGNSDGQGYIFKVDLSGKLIWQKRIGSGKYRELADVKPTLDNNYIVLGVERNSTTDYNSQDIFLIKLDTGGNRLWSKVYQNGYFQSASSVAVLSDSGFAIGSYHYSKKYDHWVIKVDKNGSTAWAKQGGGVYDENLSLAVEINGYIYFADDYRPASNDLECYIAKFALDGTFIWGKTFGGLVYDRVLSLGVTPDKNLLLGLYTESNTFGKSDGMMVWIDTGGNFISSFYAGGTDIDYFNSVAETSEGGSIAVGSTSSFGKGKSDFFINRQNCKREITCNAKNEVLTLTSVNLSYSTLNPTVVTGPSIYSSNLSIKNSNLLRTINCIEEANNAIYCYKATGAKKVSATKGNFDGVLNGSANFGSAAVGIGDVDKDGVIDIAVSAPFKLHGGNAKGSVFVLLMNPDATVKSQIEISENMGGLNTTFGSTENFGYGLAPLGDFNKDGVPDIVVGSNSSDGGLNSGALWICYLDTTGKVDSFSKISKTVGGLASSQFNGNTKFGIAIDTLGDIDNDGIVDLIVGGNEDGDGGVKTGAAHILSLKANGTVKNATKISQLTPKLSTLILNGSSFGTAVANIGDINADGFDDVAITAPNDGSGGINRGAMYVIKLGANASVLEVKKNTSLDGLELITSNNYKFGSALHGLGDINKDGYFDILVGAPLDSTGGTGKGAFFNVSVDTAGQVKLSRKYDTPQFPNSTFDNNDNFGSSLGYWIKSKDTLKVLVGAISDDDGFTNAGALYLVNLLDSCKLQCYLNTDFSYNITCPLDPINFFDLSLDAKRKVSYWKYFFGTGDSSLGVQNPKYVYKDSGTYEVKLIAGSNDTTGGCFDTMVKQINIIPKIYTVITSSNDTLCLKDTTELSLSIECAVNPVTINWTPSVGLSNTSIANPKAFPTLPQNYIVTITDKNGLKAVDSVLVYVDTTCCVSKAIFDMAKETYCIGDTIKGVNNSETKGGVDYTWKFDAPLTIQKTKDFIPVVYKTSGVKTIQLIIKDDCGIDTMTQQIYINNLPNVEAGLDSSLCLPDSVTLGVNDISSLFYQWSPTLGIKNQNAGITSAEVLTSTTYTLTAVDLYTGCFNTDSVTIYNKQIPKIKLGNDTTICETDSVSFGIADFGKYLWNTGDTSQYIRAKKAGAYILNFRQGSCQSLDTVNLTHDLLPVFSLGQDIETCGDSIINLMPNPFKIGDDYLWDNNVYDSVRQVNASGNYWLEITRGQCAYRDSIKIDMVPFPSTINLGNDTSFCETDSVRLGISNNGTYSWNTGETDQYINFKGPGQAIITFSNQKCSVKDTLLVTHDEVPNFTLGPDLELCEDSLIILKPSTFKSGYQYVWNNGATDSVLTTIDSGIYSLQIINGKCKYQDEIVIKRIAGPKDFYLGQDTAICIGDTLLFDINQGGSFTYQWQDGSGKTKYLVNTEGLYKAEISNKCGNVNAEIKIDEQDCSCTLYVPTAFTPNNDGVNDKFMPSYCELQEYSMEVFNRWGELVFKTDDINKGWDGVANGKKTLGTYFWVISLKSQYQNNGKLFYRSGTITILSYDK